MMGSSRTFMAGALAFLLLVVSGPAAGNAFPGSPSRELDEAIAAGNFKEVASLGKSLMGQDADAGAGVLCDAVADCGAEYQKSLAEMRTLYEKMSKLHSVTGNPTIRNKSEGKGEFDEMMSRLMAASYAVEDLERCTLALAEAFRGVASEKAFKEVLKACRGAGRFKLGDYLVEALGNMTHEKVPAELIKILKNRSSTWRMKVAAIDGLAKHKTEESKKMIWDHLTADDGRLRRAAQAAHAAGSQKDANVGNSAGGSRATFYELQIDCESAVFVVDISMSMKNEDAKNREGKTKSRIEVLKEELSLMLRDLPDGFNMNIVPFNRLVWVMTPDMSVLHRGSRGTVQKYIDDMDLGFMTASSDGLQLGFLVANGEYSGNNSVATGKGDRKPVDSIFFMTDGNPFLASDYKEFEPEGKKKTDTGQILSRVELWNRRARIQVNTIGIGDGRGAWLEEMAKAHNGKYVSK